MARTRTVYIALLRGINVGGHVKIAMADLRVLVAGLGLTDTRSILQSGNLVFAGKHQATADLERVLESATEKRFGLRIDYFVRTAADWQALVRHNPYAAQADSDPAHLLAMLLKKAPSAEDVKAVQSAVSGPERISAVGACAYVTYPEGIGRSRVTNARLEQMLETRGTGRNWNTVLKLQALVAAYDP